MSTLHTSPITEIDPATTAPHEPRSAVSASVGRRFESIYLLLLLLLPLIAVPLSIALGRSDFFIHHGASVWVRANDAIFQMHDRNCDVLIFGDSTAMTGIDPDIIERQTGLATCNIAVTNAVLAVTQTLALDRFLAQNHHPRFLILQFSPESLSIRTIPWEQTVYTEGLLEMLRWGDPHAARHLLLTHPSQALAFAGYSAGYTAFYAIRKTVRNLTGTKVAEDRLVMHKGFFTLPLPALTWCDSSIVPPQPEARSAATQFTADLKARYAPQTGHLILDIAPIPDCDPNRPALTERLQGLTSNPLVGLPVGLFNDQRHFTAEGSAQITHRIAQQIQGLRASGQ